MDNPLKFKLCSVRIFVRDIKRALQFYQNILGLILTADRADEGYLVFSAGPAASIIVESVSDDKAEEQVLVGRFTGVSLAVNNLFEAYHLMQQNGVPLAGPPEKEALGGTVLNVYDPDGNGLTLVQLPVGVNNEQHGISADDVNSKSVSIKPQSDIRESDPIVGGGAQSVDDVYEHAMDTMERIEQKIAQLEARVAAQQEVNRVRSSVDETNKRYTVEDIEEELAELKGLAGKNAKPKLVVTDVSETDRQLPAVIEEENDRLPAKMDNDLS